MDWLLIAIIAHLLSAGVFLVDKYIISKPLPHPIVYTFYVGVLSVCVWVLAPFGFFVPSLKQIILVLLAGVVQLFALVLFYKALNKGEVSRIIPFVGSFVAIFTLFLSNLLIKEYLTFQQVLAFALLVLGSLIISFKKHSKANFLNKFLNKNLGHTIKSIIKSYFTSAFGLAFLGALFFAFHWVIAKNIFSETSFISGLIWLRTGVVLASLTFLLSKKNRRLIFRKTEKLEPKIIKFFISSRLVGVLGSFFMYLAVFLGSVTLTNSLQGVQYIFILAGAFLFFRKFRRLREQLSKGIIIQKIVAIILISLGLVILII